MFAELGRRLREVAREEHANSGSGLERFTVTHVAPLRLAQLHGELVLEEGDPDFSIGKALVAAGPVAGDIVWVARSSGALPEFHALDVVS